MSETIFTLDIGTPPAVAIALARAYRSKERIRIWYGNKDTGAAWPEEHDIMGTVGRSTGREPIALLIANSRSLGGGAILTACIVRIDTTKGRTLYQHPLFSAGDWRVARGNEEDPTNGTWCAMHNGKPWAGGLTEEQARRFCAFMRGDRYSK